MGGGGGIGDGLVAFAAEEFELFGLLLESVLQLLDLVAPGVAAAGEVADGQLGGLDRRASVDGFPLPVVATFEEFGHPDVRRGGDARDYATRRRPTGRLRLMTRVENCFRLDSLEPTNLTKDAARRIPTLDVRTSIRPASQAPTS